MTAKLVLHLGGPEHNRQFALDEWAHTSYCPVFGKQRGEVVCGAALLLPVVRYARYEVVGDVAFYTGMED